MIPRELMLLGVFTGSVGLLVSLFAAPAVMCAIVAFGGGALFGKGYGIWEERARRATMGGRE